MKRILVVAISLFALLSLCACGKVESNVHHQPMKSWETFAYVHDWAEPKVPNGAVRIVQEMEAKVVQEPEPEPEPEYVEYYEEPVYYYDSGSSEFSGDGFMQQGVREGVNGTTETWYSSNAAYHYRTGEWSVDDNGYYRDSDGYYVVASEDHAQGEVIETSVGEAKVYDSGCDNGVVDFYVNF